MTTEIFESLTEAQTAAVAHVDGPMLVLAGPGSGKTRVVTHRIANLIAEGVDSRSILALTFTNKAADEMRRRLTSLTSAEDLWIGTFHRFCAQQLRKYADHVGLVSNYTIYDTSDSKRALKQAINATDIDPTHTPFDSLVHAISHTKSQLITAEQYRPAPGSAVGPVLQKVYPAYQQQLLRANAVDFDDLLLHVAVMLRDSAELRAMLDRRYRYILVDEYQDTNLAQYAIVRALSIDYPNLAVTGDPDQSIYGWRGANISNILEFEKDYPEVKVVRLEQNYRSTPRILSVADRLISNNTKRLRKSLFTENEDGPPVRMVAYPTQKEESEDIADRILRQVESSDRRFRNFAVFYRINALSRALEQAFRDRGVPYQMVNGVEFYQRKEIKDVFAYLQLINNPRDDVAFSRIVNVPARKIGKVTLDRLIEYAQSKRCPLFDAARNAGLIGSLSKTAAVNVARFVALVDRFGEIAHGPVEATIGHILTETGYQDLLKASENPEDQDRLANLEELLTDAHEYDVQNPGLGNLESFLEDRALVNDTDSWEDGSDAVTMMTLHAAKGLEFPSVFVVAVEQGLLPHERSMATGLEEERRLLFVGITRAERELQLSSVQYRTFRWTSNRVVPSCFLMELPREEMDVVSATGSFRTEPLDEYCQDEGYEEEVYEQIGETQESPLSIGGVSTATKVFGDAADLPDAKPDLPRIDPRIFKIGMTVMHPEYGPGKIVSLSGSGKNRTATINYAAGAGQKTVILVHSPVRPIGQ